MNVARLEAVLRSGRFKGDFDHAVDNSGDSLGLVADWVAVARWWRSHPPASRRSSCNSDYQPRDWQKGCLENPI
jgi:hypothetical protein